MATVKSNSNPVAATEQQRRDWFNGYNANLQKGVATTEKADNYAKEISKMYGLNIQTKGTPVNTSISALSGNTNAINQIKAKAVVPATEQERRKWFDGYNANLLKGTTTTAKADAYAKEIAKMYGLSVQEKTPTWFNDKSDYLGIITDPKTGKMYTQDGVEVNQQGYDTLVKAYNDKKKKEYLDQMNAQYKPIIDQYNNYLNSLQGQHQNNLNMIDSQNNRTIQGVSDNNFLAAQANEQQLAERGMGSSGVGDEFRTRNQMSANRNLQDAYMQANQLKANENAQFGSQQNEIQMALAQLNPEAQAQSQYQQWLDSTGGAKGLESKAATDKALAKQAEMEAALKNAKTQAEIDAIKGKDTGTVWLNGKNTGVATSSVKIDQAKMQLEVAKLQTTKDKQLTDSTGYLYSGGKQVKVNGKPIKTIDYMKLDETKRNNIIKSAISQQNANTSAYNAQTKRDKALADVATNIKKLEISAANLNISAEKLKLDQDKYDNSVNSTLAALNNKSVTAQVKELTKQRDDIFKQATKKGLSEKDKKKLMDKYKKITKQISSKLNSATVGK